MDSTPAREPELRQSARGDDARRERRPLALVALTNDESLLETLEGVLANDRRLHVVDRETDLAGALMDPRIGVALVDAARLQSPLAELTLGLRNQFPDLVLVVAGGPQEQVEIASQVASGVVYRFLHKPVSEQRVRLFVEAALRRHGEGQPGAGAAPVAPPPPAEGIPRLALGLGIAAIALTGLLAAWQLLRTPAPARARQAAATVAAPARDPRLVRAGSALARGELVTPAGESAADLYAAVLRDTPDDADAREGLAKVIDQLCSLAEREIAAGRLDEATRYLESARGLDPRHVRVAFIATEIANERERAAVATAHLSAARARAAAALEADAAPRAAPSSPEPDRPAGSPAPAAELPAPGSAMPAASPPPPAVPTTPAPGAPTAAVAASVSGPALPAGTAAANPAPPDAVVAASTLHRVKYREPRYPDAARARNQSGWVDVEFTVRTDGAVGAVEAVRADPPGVFDQAAIEAVSGWRFLPVLRDGAPVTQRSSVRIRFAVEP